MSQSFQEKADLEQETAFEYAKKALPLMALHGVAPLPKNYAVWFMYVSAGNPALSKEIDKIIEEKMTFSDDLNEYLHTKYVAGDDDRIVHMAANGARKLLADILLAVNDFGGKTNDYSEAMKGHLDEVVEITEDDALRSMVEKIIQSTSSMKESGAALQHRLEASRKEINELKKNLAEVKSESERDFLTNVYNRKSLERRLEEEIQDAIKEKSDLSLLMIDIDHFKRFNDDYGHLIGDEVLKIVGKTLTDSVKGKDVVARYGGEEFCVLLPNTPIGAAMIVGEAIRKAIASKELKRKDTGENYGSITVSIGVATYRKAEDTIPTFLKRADDALYVSKNNGRNCVTQEK